MTVTKKDTACIEMSGDNDPKRSVLKQQFPAPQSVLTFIVKNYSLFSDTSILSGSPIAFNNTVSLHKLTCTDFVDLGKC